MARRASAQGLRVLRGAGWKGSGAPPYWLWTQVLRGLPAVELGDAARLLDRAGAEADAPEARFRLFDAVARALAGSTPTLVVLDDLHWADENSVALLEFLRRALAAEPVLLVGAYRDEEAEPAVRALAGSGATVPLVGLDVAGVATLMATLAGRAPDTDLATSVWRRCGGNPFFTRELTRLLLARREWSAGAVRVPEGVRDTLRLRLARLSRPCTDLLAVVAVAGSGVAPEVLAEVGPDDIDTIAPVLDEAQRARVLVDEDGCWRFVHDLYRETALAQVPGAQRAALHLAIGEALLAHSGGGADPAAVGGAARLAAHFVAAGADGADQALRWSVRAAREATARLGHEDAARHYVTALGLLRDGQSDRSQRVQLLLELAAARARAGESDATRQAYLRAAELARAAPDPVSLAEAALGVAELGARSGTEDPVGIGLLDETVGMLAGTEHTALLSRVHAALARALRHAAPETVEPRAAAAADAAVALARASGDQGALAHALLAQHDVAWAPGTADVRLPLLDEMAAAARAAGDDELFTEAVLLRAAALIERGDPSGPAELARYIRLAEQLGHARGRWGALSRRATLAEILGRIDEAVVLAGEALELGEAIGLPDAMGVFGTLRGSLAAIGGPYATLTDLVPTADPLWPIYPLLQAWTQVHGGDLDAAASAIHGFSVLSMPDQYDLEFVAVAASVFAAVGSDEQREWAYQKLAPHAGVHVLVGGCASYHGAVDHHLGMLAAALGRKAAAVRHLTAAIAQCELLGASAWAALSRDGLAGLTSSASGHDAFRFGDGSWRITFEGREVQVPDAKGLHDIAVLLSMPHRPVHVFTLLGRDAPAAGADPVLDRRAVVAYRARLTELQSEIDDADAANDQHRAERTRAERAALVEQLRAASGLGGRARRLDDETERARKTVTARIRDSVRRIERVHPALAEHLRSSVHTGTRCTYGPDDERHWVR